MKYFYSHVLFDHFCSLFPCLLELPGGFHRCCVFCTWPWPFELCSFNWNPGGGVFRCRFVVVKKHTLFGREKTCRFLGEGRSLFEESIIFGSLKRVEKLEKLVPNI